MNDIPYFEETLLKTKRLRCSFLRNDKLQAMRFAGIVVAEDWRPLRAVFSLVMGLNGACILDLSDVMLFDSTLYSVVIWLRLARETRGCRFAIVARERTESRLLAAGIGKWLPISRDFSSARAELFPPEQL